MCGRALSLSMCVYIYIYLSLSLSPLSSPLLLSVSVSLSVSLSLSLSFYPFFLKKTLPAAEQSVSRGGILSNMAPPKKGQKGHQIPQVRGPDSPFPLGPESAFRFAHLICPKPLILWCFRLNPAQFRNGAKDAKNASCRKSYYLRLVWKRGFLYNRPFFSSNFWVGLFEALKAPSKPLIL